MTSEPSFGDTTRKANRVGAIAKEDKTALVVLLCQKVRQEGIENIQGIGYSVHLSGTQDAETARRGTDLGIPFL